MASKGTPATALLAKQKVKFRAASGGAMAEPADLVRLTGATVAPIAAG